MDGVLFKVITKTEISQHFEKRVVTGGITHLVEIIVLATGANAFLRGGRTWVHTFLGAEKHILELVHTRIGKKQCRVICRYQ